MLHKKIFAWLLYKAGNSAERQFAQYKRPLFADLMGNVLEIGPGTGINFQYYPDTIIWTGIEPNRYMHRYLEESARIRAFDISVQTGYAEQLNFKNSCMDTVVSTHVLCSAARPEMVIQEIIRVLKPGGKFIYFEHVTAGNGSILRSVQRFIRPFWKVAADGCILDRDTEKLFLDAGFDSIIYEKFRMNPRFLCPVSPHIYGTAVKKPYD